MSHTNKDAPNKKDALNAASDFIKVSTSLSIGALVFAVGYFSNLSALSLATRIALVVAVTAFLASSILGGLAHSRVPILFDAADYNVHDLLLIRLGISHQAGLLVGIIAIAMAFGLIMANDRPIDELSYTTADLAVAKARQSLGKQIRVTKIDLVELLRGANPTDAKLSVWHIRFNIAPLTKNTGRTEDVFVAVDGGKVSHQP
jgi:uncharacterized membrane protein